MAKYSKSDDKSKLTVEETPVPVKINKEVKLQSLVDSRLEYIGEASRRQYVWIKAGSVISVDERDAQKLVLKKFNYAGCCGGSMGGNVFQIVN